MPIYEYHCDGCRKDFEHLARTLQDLPAACPNCGSGRVAKQLSTFSAMAGSPEASLPCSSGACSTQSCPTGSCPFSG